MQVYNAPLRDMRFVLHELFQEDEFGPVAGQDEFGPELYDAILEEAARVTQEVLLPLNATGDIEGCKLENGVVARPPVSRKPIASSAKAAGPRSPRRSNMAGRGCRRR